MKRETENNFEWMPPHDERHDKMPLKEWLAIRLFWALEGMVMGVSAGVVLALYMHFFWN